MRSMTSQGSPHTRFQRALASGDPLLAWTAAAELPRLSLEDALALCLLLAERDPKRYDRRRCAGTRGCAGRCLG